MKATRKKENLKELKGSQTLSVCAYVKFYEEWEEVKGWVVGFEEW